MNIRLGPISLSYRKDKHNYTDHYTVVRIPVRKGLSLLHPDELSETLKDMGGNGWHG